MKFLKRILARLGFYDPEARKREEELQARLQAAREALTELDSKVVEASRKAERNKRVITRAISASIISDHGTKRIIGNV